MSQVLYRKYRPRSFAEVFGQEHVIATLRTQLKNGEVAHAYLFAGPQGTGKTTVARILAAELGVKELDLVEIDAASNRGVDDIRSLREAVWFQPAQGSKKLYILDEAHMLTREAFNALLKILEEPPAHVHFVLCTTEPQRLPVTVLSRCQRFNFELADKQLMKSYVQHLLTLEQMECEVNLIDFIAEKSGGSFRDAAVLLEKVIALTKNSNLDTDSVLKRLGLGIEKELLKLKKLLLQKDASGALQELNSIVERGIDAGLILDTLIKQLRYDLVSLITSNKSNINGDVGYLLLLLKGLSDARSRIKVSLPHHLPIELAIVEAVSGKERAAWSLTREGDVSNANSWESSAVAEVSTGEGGSKLWHKVMQEVRRHNHSLEALLKGSWPQSLEEKVIRLNFRYRFHKEKVEEAHNRRLVEEVFSKVLGRPVKIKCELVESGRGKGEVNPSKSGQEKQAGGRVQKDKEGTQKGDDILKLAQEIFGGEIIE